METSRPKSDIYLAREAARIQSRKPLWLWSVLVHSKWEKLWNVIYVLRALICLGMMSRTGQCLATLLLISCKLVPPGPAWVEEPVCSVWQSSSDGTTNNPPLSQDALNQHRNVGCQNWNAIASTQSAAGGEREQQKDMPTNTFQKAISFWRIQWRFSYIVLKDMLFARGYISVVDNFTPPSDRQAGCENYDVQDVQARNSSFSNLKRIFRSLKKLDSVWLEELEHIPLCWLLY